MERFYPYLLKGTNWILAGLISLLGFSCSGDGIEELTEEYGSPHADYEIKGKVVNRQNNPISNIQIAVSDSVREEQIPVDNIIYTDTEGQFLWRSGNFPRATFKIIATDIDSDKNGGQFSADTSFVSFKNAIYENGSKWYKGEAKQEVTIVLDEQINTGE